MIKLLHTGDVHLGRQFPRLQSKAEDYREQLIRTFEKIADLAGKEEVSLLLIAGDLFDTNRIYGITVNKVLSAFRKLESFNIRACLIPGCHDDYGQDSIYRSLLLPANITVLTPDHNRQTYPDLNLTVHGLFPEAGARGSKLFQEVSSARESRFQVGMIHGAINFKGDAPDENAVLAQEEIAGSGLDYLALGHYHSFQICSQGPTAACYCGSPEPIDLDYQVAGNAVIVKLTEGNAPEFQPVPIGNKKCDSITIEIGPSESVEAIVQKLEVRSDPNLILEVILTGTRQIDNFPNIQEIENTLEERFFSLRMIDKIHPVLGAANLQSFPEKTVIGRYLRIVGEKIATARNPEDQVLYEEALKLGFTLLQGNLKAIE